MTAIKLKGKLVHLAKVKVTDVGERRAVCAQIRSIPPVGIQVGMFTPNFIGFGLRNIVRILIVFNKK